MGSAAENPHGATDYLWKHCRGFGQPKRVPGGRYANREQSGGAFDSVSPATPVDGRLWRLPVGEEPQSGLHRLGRSPPRKLNLFPTYGIVFYHGRIFSPAAADRYLQYLLRDIAWKQD